MRLRPVGKISTLPPSEQDLHAYLDDELSPEQRIRVIEWLLDHPDVAKELFIVYLREDLLRRLLAPSLAASESAFASSS